MNMQRDAVFDRSGQYRYRLWRAWSEGPCVAFVMLNPSTADAQQEDATIRRCIGFARTWGYGSLEVVNLFAQVATRPIVLQAVSDPVGQDNDRFLLAAVSRAERLVLAWGEGGTLYRRDREVLQLLSAYTLYCLGKNRSGQPRHPLYLRRETVPMVYEI